MKIVLLLANSGEEILRKCKEHITTVLEELDIEVDIVDLHTLPYYKQDQISPVASLLAERIEKSKGVIALASVHVGAVHSSMQSFFEHFTRYTESIKNKPLLAITYSSFQGERQAAYQILQEWGILGGADGGASFFNAYANLENALENIERNIESYYRLIKQERASINSSEYYFYNQIKGDLEENSPKIWARKEENGFKDAIFKEEPKELEKKEVHVNLSTKEQNIQELTQLLKQQIGYEGEKEFVELPLGTYKKPTMKVNEVVDRGGIKVSSIPHYFIAQHDKEFHVTVQYTITDTGERSFLTIKDGDCIYEEGILPLPTVEIILTQEVLEEVVQKQLTYQKAFMIGKLKVKGNFGVLSKLDQSFKWI